MEEYKSKLVTASVIDVSVFIIFLIQQWLMGTELLIKWILVPTFIVANTFMVVLSIVYGVSTRFDGYDFLDGIGRDLSNMVGRGLSAVSNNTWVTAILFIVLALLLIRWTVIISLYGWVPFAILLTVVLNPNEVIKLIREDD